MKFLMAKGGVRPEAGPRGWRAWLPTSKARVIGVVAVAGAMVLSSTTNAGASSGSAADNYGPTGPVPAVGTPISGGTAYFMEGQNAPPTYVFPFISPQVCSTMNYGQLTYLMYRPLYWFGNNNNPGIDYNYSIGEPPVYSGGDKTVTITLKHWMWSDGEQVTSRDVEFWMNMELALAKQGLWCAYTPGYFPYNVKSMAFPNATTVVFHLDKAYNPTWFTDNELSQISPMPLAWDVTSTSASTPANNAPNLPDTTVKGVTAVYHFLDCQAGDANSCASKSDAQGVTTYASSKYWSIVDGPWKLKSFTSTGQVSFVPNPDYSGSPKPKLAEFVEVPFTSDEAILNELKSGGPNALQVAELPDEYLPQLSSIEAEGYTAVNFPSFSFSYFPLNLGNPTFGPVFRQLYFRQAFQHLVNAQGWLEKILLGYGVPTYGPVPLEPHNTFADNFEKTNQYPFSISTAVSILKAHGWTEVNGLETCTSPGSGPNECGPGVTKGLQLKFGLQYQSGVVITQEEMTDLKSDAAQAGIDLVLSEAPFAVVISNAINCGPDSGNSPTSAKCKWTAQDWGAGWVYAPDYAPTGEAIFYTGAGADFSGYSDTEADHLMDLTTTAPASQTQAAMDNYQNYMAEQLPVVYFPTATGNPTAAAVDLVSKHLGGFTNNAETNLTPETWYLTK
ncbi:MAG TPA: ABC transporter substrate-binding protein [Acidimicrobiales bacterium]|nr:ABC transporter substrate-binding protein [Acidimicrobiales bacterium]